MNIKAIKIFVLSIFLLAQFLPGNTQADVIGFTSSFSLSPDKWIAQDLSVNDNTFTETTFTKTFSVSQFDSNLGTLNSVNISVNQTSDFNFEQLMPSNQMVEYDLYGLVRQSSEINNFSSTDSTWIAKQGSCPSIYNSVYGYNVCDFGVVSGTDQYIDDFAITTGLSAFIGAGTYSFESRLLARVKLAFTPLSVASPSLRGSWEGTANVTYNYTPVSSQPTPVPAPATFWLMFIGMVGLIYSRTSSRSV